jgi:hypothetical protein
MMGVKNMYQADFINVRMPKNYQGKRVWRIQRISLQIRSTLKEAEKDIERAKEKGWTWDSAEVYEIVL